MEVQKGVSSFTLISFSSLLRVYTGCFGHIRACMWENYFMPAYIHGLSLDNPCTRRAARFGRVNPLKNKKKCIMKELKCSRDTFVLTWSERKFISSSESPRINFFSKGDFLPFGQFSNYNGENDLSAFIYRLFWPFLPLF